MNTKGEIVGGALLLGALALGNGCAASPPGARITLYDEMQGAYDLRTHLEKNGELHLLKDYKYGASNYWIVLPREINGLKKNNPKYANYIPLMTHRELKEKGLLEHFYALAEELHAKYQKGDVPPEVDSVTEYVE